MGRNSSGGARSTALNQLELPLASPRPERTAEGDSVRALRLGRRIVTYRFRRATRRTIGLTVDREGLAAAAPRWVTIAEVEAFIREKERWITARLIESAAATRARLNWSWGTALPFRGASIAVLADERHDACRLVDQTLRVPIVLGSSAEARRETVIAWLERYSLAHFRARAMALAPPLNVPVPDVRLSRAKTQWGHCTIDHRGLPRVHLHWRLIHFPDRLIDYVVVHELAHIREMNHSPRFWAIVEQLCPDHRAARISLHSFARSLPEI